MGVPQVPQKRNSKGTAAPQFPQATWPASISALGFASTAGATLGAAGRAGGNAEGPEGARTLLLAAGSFDEDDALLEAGRRALRPAARGGLGALRGESGAGIEGFAAGAAGIWELRAGAAFGAAGACGCALGPERGNSAPQPKQNL